MISALSTPFTSSATPRSQFSTSVVGSSLIQSNQSLLPSTCNLASNSKVTVYKSTFTVRASGDQRRSGSTGIFIGGFILGGIAVGTLGCIYAPQISKALTGADRKDLMRKLPKFIYDEEKALEKTRKVLAKKIAQLNLAIDEVSSQLHTDDAPNGTAVNSDEIQAST
ncbi:uncharacterized protein [Euphorbia lathyris]|uniref:uncharacterized protein n=1 Tax=Euphorbia lathyris TaxID=212925 RepID=UPI0033137E19